MSFESWRALGKGTEPPGEGKGLSQARTITGDQRLDRLLRHIIEEISCYAEDQIQLVKRLSRIGIALSAEKDLDNLLELIVDEARSFSRADAGTLYLIDEQEEFLHFEILQNDTLNVRMGGTSNEPIPLPPIRLKVDGCPNYSNVSSYTALTGEVVNIPDVYRAEGFDFTGPMKYDEATGYRSVSMLVIPMKNHRGKIIGVLQLLNALDRETRKIIPFSEELIEIVGCLASQAAVALDNAQLIKSLKDLFDGFLKSIATAIDQKSPYTGGHVRRVVELCGLIAVKINETREGHFAEVRFSEEELEELRIAAWMHDVGKIIVPEHVVNKRTKLETVFDRVELLRNRFDTIELTLRNRYLERKIDLLRQGAMDEQVEARLDEELQTELRSLRKEREFICVCNTSMELLSDESIERLREIGGKAFVVDGCELPYLTAEEMDVLSVRKGNLTAEERRSIEQHALMTREILKEVPFPRELSRLLEFAVAHHEKLDGSGYPFGLHGDQIPLQARIIAVADVFDALTSKDRPYKKALRLPEVVRILSAMKSNHLDPDILDLFIESGLCLDYARRELGPGLIDP